MTAPARAIVVMAKEPRPGRVKTRLMPELSAAAAAALYRAFLHDVLDALPERLDAQRFLFVHPASSVAWFRDVAPARCEVLPQAGESLAERMIAAFDELFRRGFRAVVVRNSDSPTLPARRIDDAFRSLDLGADVALVPDRGGGYCLVGLKRPAPELFRGVAMSTGSVLDETLQRARRLELRIEVFEPCLDVDTPADLAALRQELQSSSRERACCERTAAFLATLPRLRQGFPSGASDGAVEGGERMPRRPVP